MATSEELYRQTINIQKEYLAKLQTAFNNRCDEIAVTIRKKLDQTPETDVDGRKKIAEEQKKLLDDALAQLKNEITRSGNELRHKLEEIQAQSEAIVLKKLEEQMTRI